MIYKSIIKYTLDLLSNRLPTNFVCQNKQRQPKVHSRMDNPDNTGSIGRDTEQRYTKTNAFYYSMCILCILISLDKM